MMCAKPNPMGTVVYYLRLAALGVWFAISTLACICLLPFRWKDPSMGAVAARAYGFGTRWLLGIRTNVHNAARLYTNQPCIYVPNHQSNLDMFTMGCMYPYRTVVIGKKELRWVPLFGLFFVGAGNVMIDRGNKMSALAGLDLAKQAVVRDKKSIWIFAEGTRSRGRGLLPFKKGAFHLAIAAQVPIVPIVQQPLKTYFDYEKKRIYPGEIELKVLEPIATTGMTIEDMPRLMELVRTSMLEGMKTLPQERRP